MKTFDLHYIYDRDLEAISENISWVFEYFSLTLEFNIQKNYSLEIRNNKSFEIQCFTSGTLH